MDGRRSARPSKGPFFPDWEFQTLMGGERDEMRAVLDAWPNVSDGENADVAINNAFNNLLGYPHDEWEAWAKYSDADPEELARTFTRWRAERGISRASSYFDGLS